MRTIYDWVPGFQDLVRRIGDGGSEYLAEGEPSLLRHGDENIDPFSFFYYMEKIKQAFPGCKYYEIQTFLYLWATGKLPINSCYYQVSTNVYDDGRDFWEEFDRNNCVYTGGPSSGKPWPADGSSVEPPSGYRLNQPGLGDIVLVRFGISQGRGIGIVYRNDYRETLSLNSRIHVLWLNKVSTTLRGHMPRRAISQAGEASVKAFRSTDEYSPTFELLERL